MNTNDSAATTTPTQFHMQTSTGRLHLNAKCGKGRLYLNPMMLTAEQAARWPKCAKCAR